MAAESQRLVILDRDGVINGDSPDFIKTPEEWEPLPGSLDAIARLTDAGATIVVASNQSGLGRGLISPENLDAIHEKMCQAVEQQGGRLDGIFFCPHRPDDGCDCRKPRPGLLQQIALTYNADLGGVPAVGDSLRDLEATREAGALPVLVRTGNGNRTQAVIAAGGTGFHLVSGNARMNGRAASPQNSGGQEAGEDAGETTQTLVKVFDDLAAFSDSLIAGWSSH